MPLRATRGSTGVGQMHRVQGENPDKSLYCGFCEREGGGRVNRIRIG